MNAPSTDLQLAPSRDYAPAIDATSRQRLAYADVFRGLLIAHMALDHASLFFNAGRGAEELAALQPAAGPLSQFLLRFTGVPVAPGFFFMAGFMIAVSSFARMNRGLTEHDITKRLITRGLVLIAVDALVMGLPRALMGFYSFMVLSSIGVAIIVLAWARRWPTKVLLPMSLAVLFLHPLLDVSELPLALQAVIYEPVREGVVRSMYPVLPWIGFVGLGFVVGRECARDSQAAQRWMTWGIVSLGLFAAIRLLGGYGNSYGYESVASIEFWQFAKYPPDLAFTTFALAFVFFALAALKQLTRVATPLVLRPFAVFGRVPFFFYIVHFYVLGVAAALLRVKVGLAEMALIWLVLLALMLWLCHVYQRKKIERPNLITRYI